MNRNPDIAFGQSLVSHRLITEEELDRCLSECQRTSEGLAKALVKLGIISDGQALQALSEHLGIPYIQIKPAEINQSLLKSIPARVITHYQFMPISLDKDVLTAAVADPLDTRTLDELALVLGHRVKPVLASSTDISKAIKECYGIGADTVERMISDSDIELELVDRQRRKEEDIDDESIDASVIKFVNQILLEAIRSNATDIHIEPFEDDLRIRYRIDGVLHQAAIPSSVRHFKAPIVSRIKIMADLNIAERRLPQDGRIKVKMGGEEFDLRVSVLPTPHGESVDIRILSRATMFLTLQELGLSEADLATWEDLIQKPHGIILVTGPTGSGKTTTLYASLSKINSVEQKIITIEDPIEYQLKGITQMEVLPKIGFDFARGLRSMLRHDPDIMMIGEIRDYETAETAIRSALTGHLVFSTIHTNDAAGAITRLVDMGVEPYLVASSVIAMTAQRLVRLICKHCKRAYVPEEALLLEMGADPAECESLTFFRGQGCEECKHTGYSRRTAIYEFLVPNSEIREQTMRQVPSHTIKETAKTLGMKTLKQDGWEKVKKGLTTIEEVLRVAEEEDSP